MLDQLQQLREYLGTIHPQAITINLWLPNSFTRIHTLLNAYAITTSPTAVAVADEVMKQACGEQAPAHICEAAATALFCDADIVVTENSGWYPFYEEFERLGILLGSPQVMLRQSEIFVRGHDEPWVFADPMFDAPWGTFYFFAKVTHYWRDRNFWTHAIRKA